MKTKKCYESHKNCNGNTCKYDKEVKSQHTPGPWKRLPQTRVIYYGKGSLDEVICRMEGTGYSADASLIAAAPDLLEAAKYSLRIMMASGFNDDSLSLIRTAIAKAEGK